MTPAEANRLALAAVRKVLDASHGFDVVVAGTPVSVRVVGREPMTWPSPVIGLDPATDGECPEDVELRCEWEGGGVSLFVSALHARRDDAVVLGVQFRRGRHHLLAATNVSAAVLASDAPEVAIATWFGVKKRGRRPEQHVLNRKLRALVSDSGMPMLGEAAVELFALRREDASVLPSPEDAFERLVHVNLLKLDFFSRGSAASLRGRPLIHVPELEGIGDQVSEGGDEDSEEDSEAERRHWAGGFGERERLERFLRENVWEMGWSRDEDRKGARQAWKHFEQIRPGDLFAIKGFGGTYQLTVHLVGEVVDVDLEHGRLRLKRIPKAKLYKGPAPAGSGAGSWFETLVPVTREDVIALLFDESDAPTWTGPKNVILYGPPGTGKTFRLREEIRPKFMRRSRSTDRSLEVLAELSWFEVVVAALADVGGRASAAQLAEHSFVTTKYRMKELNAPIGSRVWATLQAHTVEESQTVRYARRHGVLCFDKEESGVWHFVGDVPPEVPELVSSLRPKPVEISEDFTFVTFHQSYAYEDFIEGIRPRMVDDEETGGGLSYELRPGLFLRAAQAAVRLAGFEGTIDELCRSRTHEEREEIFRDAPPYALFIDEINRGNVSRILGELITLLEEDRRLGAPGEIIVQLPGSRRFFGVPPNLCVIGTMNTADRSVEALDSALRRRFAFWECVPEPVILDGVVVEGGVDVGRMMRVINERLELLLDRDHLLGHALFLPVRDEPTLETLKHVFATSILPLLSEYFYADLGRVGLVLGRGFVQRVGTQTRLASFDHEAADTLSERMVYRLKPIDDVSTADFRAIYE
jgi:hypothetical protein